MSDKRPLSKRGRGPGPPCAWLCAADCAKGQSAHPLPDTSPRRQPRCDAYLPGPSGGFAAPFNLMAAMCDQRSASGSFFTLCEDISTRGCCLHVGIPLKQRLHVQRRAILLANSNSRLGAELRNSHANACLRIGYWLMAPSLSLGSDCPSRVGRSQRS